MVLLVLAAIWAAVLLPPYLERRRAVHPSHSIGDFRRQLHVLQRTGDPYAPMPSHPAPRRSMTRTDVLRRRRDVLATLAVAAVLTLLLALVAGGAVWLLHLGVDAALLGYVALLLQVQQQRPQARAAARRHAARPAPRMAFEPAAPARLGELHRLPRPSATQQALLRRQAN